MFNNHDIILLFSDFYNILSFNLRLLMIKTYNQGLSGSGLRFLAGSGFDEYGSETLVEPEPICL